MFKGSRRIGSLDNEREEAVLARLREAFEVLRMGEQEAADEKTAFKEIESLSREAASFGLPGEYDRILSHLGARELNAWTSLTETVYSCDIPSIELPRWLALEAERFSQPVFRSFLTEFEAILEEFNQDMDDDLSRARELLMSRLFAGHPYGDHGILGKKEHLQHPSIFRIEEFYRRWYRPENMALCLAGDFDRKEALALIEEYWGEWTPSLPDSRNLQRPRDPIPLKRAGKYHLTGADSAFTMTGFRFGGMGSEDYIPLVMLDMILNNSQAGLIDLNLVQKQRILEGGSSLSSTGEFSWFVLYGSPRQGQSLGSVHRLLLKQIDLIRKGRFDPRLLAGVIKVLEMERIQDLEDNQIVDTFAECFAQGLDWEDYLGRLDRLRALKPEDLIRFVKEKFTSACVRVDKREGEEPAFFPVEKPEIEPLPVDCERESSFFKALRRENPGCNEAVFPDYKALLSRCILQEGQELICCRNRKNDLFEVSFIFPEGKASSPWLPVAGDYLPYWGTEDLKPREVQKEAFLLGLDFSFQVDMERSRLSLYGREEDLPAALAFMQRFVRRGRGSRRTCRRYIHDILKRRKDAMLSKKSLLFGGLYSWGLYGEDSPFRDILDEKELKAASSGQLIGEIRQLFDLPHEIYYYGRRSPKEMKILLEEFHPSPGGQARLPRPCRSYEEKAGEGKVFFTHYDMSQVEIYRLAPCGIFNPGYLTGIELFNEFFGEGLNSLFFQEIREARGLAYSAWSGVSLPDRPHQHHILSSYIGTQSDRLAGALRAMDSLFERLPRKAVLFEEARTALLKSMASDRIDGPEIFWTFMEARDLGLPADYKVRLYRELESFSFSMMEDWFRDIIMPAPANLLVLGSREHLDLAVLESRGPFRELSPEELFRA